MTFRKAETTFHCSNHLLHPSPVLKLKLCFLCFQYFSSYSCFILVYSPLCLISHAWLPALVCFPPVWLPALPRWVSLIPNHPSSLVYVVCVLPFSVPVCLFCFSERSSDIIPSLCLVLTTLLCLSLSLMFFGTVAYLSSTVSCNLFCFFCQVKTAGCIFMSHHAFGCLFCWLPEFQWYHLLMTDHRQETFFFFYTTIINETPIIWPLSTVYQTRHLFRA